MQRSRDEDPSLTSTGTRLGAGGWTRAAALAVAIAIAATAFEPFYLRIFMSDRARLSARMTALPYWKLPGMRTFLDGVRARTRDGDAIAIAATLHRQAGWLGSYDYLYERAHYLLAGRNLVPLISIRDQPQPENLARADYIAGYRCQPEVRGFTVVWRSQDGVLLRRQR
jgi:hypothetical protein